MIAVKHSCLFSLSIKMLFQQLTEPSDNMNVSMYYAYFDQNHKDMSKVKADPTHQKRVLLGSQIVLTGYVAYAGQCQLSFAADRTQGRFSYCMVRLYVQMSAFFVTIFVVLVIYTEKQVQQCGVSSISEWVTLIWQCGGITLPNQNVMTSRNVKLYLQQLNCVRLT